MHPPRATARSLSGLRAGSARTRRPSAAALGPRRGRFGFVGLRSGVTKYGAHKSPQPRLGSHADPPRPSPRGAPPRSPARCFAWPGAAKRAPGCRLEPAGGWRSGRDLAHTLGADRAWTGAEFSLVQATAAAAVVGLQLSVRAYPDGDPIRDAGQSALLDRFRARLPPTAGWATEVPMPIPGDRRAWDARVVIDGRRAGCEAEMQLLDLQALERRPRPSQLRDRDVDILLLVVADTVRNRHVLAPASRGAVGAPAARIRARSSRLPPSEDPCRRRAGSSSSRPGGSVPHVGTSGVHGTLAPPRCKCGVGTRRVPAALRGYASRGRRSGDPRARPACSGERLPFHAGPRPKRGAFRAPPRVGTPGVHCSARKLAMMRKSLDPAPFQRAPLGVPRRSAWLDVQEPDPFAPVNQSRSTVGRGRTRGLNAHPSAITPARLTTHPAVVPCTRTATSTTPNTAPVSRSRSGSDRAARVPVPRRPRHAGPPRT